MPVAGLIAGIDAVLCVNRRHHRIADVAPRALVSKLRKYFHVDWRTAMFHARGGSDEFTAVERNIELDLGQHFRQQANHRLDVAGAVAQNLFALLVCEGPTFHNPLTQIVFAFAVPILEPVVSERAQQSLTGGYGAAVGDAAKLSAEIEDVGWQWPVESQMAAELGIGNKADEQS